MKKCFTYQEVKWLQGVVSLSVIYLLIEKKHIKVQYNFTDTVDQASKVNPNRQYSRSSPQLTNLEGGGGREVGGENSAPSASGFLDRRRFAKSFSKRPK